MAEADISLLEVTVGNAPEEPVPLFVAAEVRLGGSGMHALPETVVQRLIYTVQPFTPYVVLETENSEKAESLCGVIKEFVQKPLSAGEETFLHSLLSKLRKYGEISVEARESSVVLFLTLDPILKQQVDAYFCALSLQASQILAEETALKLELALGNPINTILSNRNAIGTISESLRIRVEVTLWKGLSAALAHLSEILSAPANLTKSLSAFGFFRSADLKFRFNSVSDLPDSVTASIPDSGVLTALVAMGRSLLETSDLALLRSVAEAVSGAVYVCGVAKFASGTVSARVGGAGKVLGGE